MNEFLVYLCHYVIVLFHYSFTAFSNAFHFFPCFLTQCTNSFVSSFLSHLLLYQYQLIRKCILERYVKNINLLNINVFWTIFVNILSFDFIVLLQPSPMLSISFFSTRRNVLTRSFLLFFRIFYYISIAIENVYYKGTY